MRLATAQPAAPVVPAAPKESAEAELRLRHSGERILLAEDEPTNAETIMELVKLAGLSIDTAADGAEALALAERNRYDLVLTDLQMPRLDGFTAAHRLRELPGYAKVPILALSANVFAADRARAMQVGMNDFIAKPVEPDAFFESLLRWLDGRASPG